MIQGNSLRRFVTYSIRAFAALAALMTLILLTAPVARAQTYTVLYRFCSNAKCTNGSVPRSLVQATDGDFYGTTSAGGDNDDLTCVVVNLRVPGCGTVFKITPGGTLTTLYNFCNQANCLDGAVPSTPLTQATNGDLYGTTGQGGADDNNNYGGTVFKITPGGTLTTLYNFCSDDYPNCSSFPEGALIQAINGDLYGTDFYSGQSVFGGFYASGSVFKITPGGAFTTVYTFCSQPNCTDGASPTAGLVQASNGDLYGTTSDGGTNDGGTIFKITPGGTLTTLYNFCSLPDCTDGAFPFGALVQATNGDLYGTTVDGGSTNVGAAGTIFKITLDGTLTTLYSFCSLPNCADGKAPEGALIQATNGDIYGTTQLGGNNSAELCVRAEGCGTIFKITPSGAFTTVYTYCSQPNCTDGAFPGVGSLMQATNGDLYGWTIGGGNLRIAGTIFRLDLGLGPFVALQTSLGEVGAKVIILGTDLTGATSVTFNGTPATFTVNSTGGAITATVPTGATTGTVKVTTLSGTLVSNKPFQVIS